MTFDLHSLTTLIFDLDQTLIDRRETFTRFLHGQFDRFSSRLTNLDATSFVNVVLAHDNNGYTAKQAVYGSLIEDLDISDISVSEFYDDYKANYGFSPALYPGTTQALKQFSERYKVGLVTNGRSRGQQAKIENSGIASYFDAIVISEEAGVKKPDERIFRLCLERLDAQPAESAYIGDHPENDILPVAALGLTPIWMKSEWYEAPSVPHVSIGSIAELHDLLIK